MKAGLQLDQDWYYKQAVVYYLGLGGSVFGSVCLLVGWLVGWFVCFSVCQQNDRKTTGLIFRKLVERV